MFTLADKVGFAMAIVVVAIMGALVWHGPFHAVNKPVAAPSTKVNTAPGKADFLSLGCVGCHTLTSVGASGTVGPSLNGIGSKHDYAWLVVQLTKPCSPGHQLPGYACQTMEGVASNLSQKQRVDLAHFLSAQK